MAALRQFDFNRRKQSGTAAENAADLKSYLKARPRVNAEVARGEFVPGKLSVPKGLKYLSCQKRTPASDA